MFGIKKYDVLKRFKGRRTDIILATKDSQNRVAEWPPQEVIILIHLASMGFINVSTEKEGELAFQITEDGKLWLDAASTLVSHEFGRGAS